MKLLYSLRKTALLQLREKFDGFTERLASSKNTSFKRRRLLLLRFNEIPRFGRQLHRVLKQNLLVPI